MVAQKNEKHLRSTKKDENGKVNWILSDLFENVNETYDMILSNPPYIRTAEIEKLQDEVKLHDPFSALDGKEDGLYFYRKIVTDAKQFLKTGGILAFEIGYDQGKEVSDLMKKAGYSPEEAGAIESVASTGGQLMPPIMGASAFIMAELLNVEYINIAHAAVIPAFAYFIGTYLVVQLVSKKRNIGRHTDLYIDEKPILPRLYRLIPVVVIVALMIYGFSFSRSAIICTFLSIGISLL